MEQDDMKSRNLAPYVKQLDSNALKALEVDSDVNEDRKREKLLDDSLDSFLTEISKE